MSDGKKEVPEETYIPAGAHEEPGPDDIGPGDDDFVGDNDDDDDGGDKSVHLSDETLYADLLVDADKYGGDEEVGDVDGHEDISEIGFAELDGTTGTKGPNGKSFRGTVMHQIYRLAHLPPTLASYVLRDPVRVFVFESARVCTNVASEAR